MRLVRSVIQEPIDNCDGDVYENEGELREQSTRCGSLGGNSFDTGHGERMSYVEMPKMYKVLKGM